MAKNPKTGQSDQPRVGSGFVDGLLSSTLAISRIPKQIQWFSGSGLEALSPCFATVFFCKWPKSSSDAHPISTTLTDAIHLADAVLRERVVYIGLLDPVGPLGYDQYVRIREVLDRKST